MKYKLIISLLLISSLLMGKVSAQDAVSDSVDVLHYNLVLDMGSSVAKQLRGNAEITFVLTRPCRSITFDLICDSIRPVSLDGVVVRGFSYDRDMAQLRVNINGGQPGDTHVVSVPYFTNGYLESYGWGGLHMDNNIHYNLGVAFQAYPHVYGRSWFPCRDNFYDKATYRLEVTSKPSWRAVCSGLRQSETANPDGSNTSVWLLDHPTPTYLVSVSSANWHLIERTYQGHYDTYPALIGFTTHDSAAVQSAYGILDDVLPMYERCFGPYRWDRIGYISTPQGSMEHVSNIGLVSSCMATLSNSCQMTICHEFAHAWFGNLITCAGEGDMWFNEGGATFCEEVATEAAFSPEAACDYYQGKLSAVLRSAHLDDDGYRALSGMSPFYTYGTTTYQKGAMVWHSLRGVLGDSLFYSCMRRLFYGCAFGNLDAASLRDSLSLYSGIDLTGFFDFHVFNPGFVDYSIDRFEPTYDNSARLTLRQLLRGTDRYARGNRVPVTFFSSDLRRSKQWMLFDDSVATSEFSLPFVPSFAVVDYDHQLSDACVDDTVLIRAKGLYKLDNSFCAISVPDSPAEAWVHMGHHFVHPTGDTLDGVVRLADRYWQVSGILPWETEYTGRFLYNQGSNGSSGAANVDLGFYDNRNTLDSLCLLYRPDAGQQWQVVSRRRTSNSTIASGYFTARLLPGQYTLGVIDTALVGISQPSVQGRGEAKIAISPNPSRDFFRIDLQDYDDFFNVIVLDTTGKKVLQMNDMRSGDTLRHNLPAGSYVVLIQNNFLSLHSQIIVQ